MFFEKTGPGASLRLGLFLVLASLSILIVGCSLATGRGSKVELGADDNGTEIELEVGQKAVITLKSNPTTGFSWEMVESEDAVLKQFGEAEYEAESKLVGAGGAETLSFEAVEAGEMDLKLIYHRSWEEGIDPAEAFEVRVVVK